MSICCVVGCTGPRPDNEFYFEFPTSRLLRKRWLDALNTSKVTIDSRICCKHFTKQDYEMVRGKMRLRSKVVPTLFGDEKINNESESSQDSTETADSTTNNQNIKQTDNHTEITKNDHEKQNNHENNEVDDKSDGKRPNNENSDEKNEKCVDENGKGVGENEKGVDKNDKGDDKIEKGVENKKEVDENKKGVDKNEKSVDENKKGVDENEKSVDKSVKSCDVTDNNKNEDNLLEKSDLNGDNSEQNSRKRSSDTNAVEKSKSRKTRFKITPKRVIRTPVDVSEDSINSSDSVHSVTPQPDPKEDIEGILTHYYIENKKTERQVAAMTDALQQELEKQCSVSDSEPANNTSDPVFIELSVGQGRDRTSPANDCLMVLESVQCEIDPSMILASREEIDDNSSDKIHIDDDDVTVGTVETKKPDPISLLTSSDEDDVIIQEPKIDTVEVSSADTDEDDMPLVSLVKKKKKSKNNLIKKLLWGGKDYYCAKCRYHTLSSKEYNKHMNSHTNSKIIHICSECGYTTCSELQLNRHKQKHKNDKRFKCDYCKYSAKHSMSLMYHMKTHKKKDSVIATVDLESSSKKYSCKNCEYTTSRSNDLKRHMRRKHQEYDGDDEDYCP